MSTESTTESREFAPSALREESPAVARLVGMAGLFALIVGAVSVVAAQFGSGWLGEGKGYLFAVAGLTGLFVHAVRDADTEVRRLYGAFAGVMLLAAVVVSVIPGPFTGAVEKTVGYHLLPWGALGSLISLMFTVPFLRHETEPGFRTPGLKLILAAGAVLAVGSVAFGVARPESLAGPGAVFALIGLGFLAAYLCAVDTNDGIGYRVAVAVGTVGSVAVIWAVGRAVIPTVLHEGPVALKNPLGANDGWKLAARVGLILASFAVAFLGGVRSGLPGWLKGGLGVFGLALGLALAAGCFAKPIPNGPAPFLVPGGVLLAAVGLAYVAVALAITSDLPLVVLTRRELAAYFFSPIAYIMFLGMAFVSGVGYMIFLDILGDGRDTPEPIVQQYWGLTMGAAFSVLFLVPALTMRLFSEEKRTGTLEVLLTAPVGETSIVLSKFTAALTVFLLAWVPAGLYLIALRVAGGKPFDFKPLLGYYLAMAACGSSFIGMGMFFSSLTRNQVVAAVLTFAALFVMLLTAAREAFDKHIGAGVIAVLGKLDFFGLWSRALGGHLPVTDVLVHVSLAGFWLFLTVKVLEARRWS
ncbi:MAG: ABC transporter permease [Fimbriiglobus sp.]